ncbi:uncharacterized protein LOC144152419 [Haemaphysalis longicornis]|uniref:Uncharacterized protein n=1 Tax=Haemaphysalis longicornis TaxID=44386 RepID=A0A9J6H3F5_HAELO|nr:hypothetical protein HPB48_022025 [Haemaphysalis longicornis]KAH9382314.1 hypothetical protein HPB48_013959 [Haemaphysalis longicornis]
MPTGCDGDKTASGGGRLRALRERLRSCKPVQRFLDWYEQFWGDTDEEERLHEADVDDGFVNWFCLPCALRKPEASDEDELDRTLAGDDRGRRPGK